MVDIKSRMDIIQVFCDLDDFFQVFESTCKQAYLPQMNGENLSRCRMFLSEIMTIIIGFHRSGYRTCERILYLAIFTSLEECLSNSWTSRTPTQEKKPSLDLNPKALPALPAVAF